MSCVLGQCLNNPMFNCDMLLRTQTRSYSGDWIKNTTCR